MFYLLGLFFALNVFFIIFIFMSQRESEKKMEELEKKIMKNIYMIEKSAIDIDEKMNELNRFEDDIRLKLYEIFDVIRQKD